MRSLWWSTCGIWKPHSIAKTVSKYLTQYIDVWIDAYASSKISLRQIEDVFSQLWSPEICYIWSMGSDGQLFPEEICQKHHSIFQLNVCVVLMYRLLYKNQLTGSIPDTWQRMVNIKDLYEPSLEFQYLYIYSWFPWDTHLLLYIKNQNITEFRGINHRAVQMDVMWPLNKGVYLLVTAQLL